MPRRFTCWGWRLTLLLLLPGVAQAASGTNLRWQDCFGDGGAINRYFACNTNSGVESLVGSFEVGADMLQVSGLEIVVDIASPTTQFPAWWQFKNAGSCRATALSLTTVPPVNASACRDWSTGQALGGIASYAVGLRGPGTARLLAALAVPQATPATLVTGQEYFGFVLRIQHAKTVGTGACEGCCTSMNVVFNSIKVATQVPANDRVISGPTNGGDSNFALWQGGHGIPGRFGPGASPPCGETVPTRSRTWSELKSLYR